MNKKTYNCRCYTVKPRCTDTTRFIDPSSPARPQQSLQTESRRVQDSDCGPSGSSPPVKTSLQIRVELLLSITIFKMFPECYTSCSVLLFKRFFISWVIKSLLGGTKKTLSLYRMKYKYVDDDLLFDSPVVTNHFFNVFLNFLLITSNYFCLAYVLSIIMSLLKLY